MKILQHETIKLKRNKSAQDMIKERIRSPSSHGERSNNGQAAPMSRVVDMEFKGIKEEKKLSEV